MSNGLDGLVFEVGFSEGILPLLEPIRKAIGDKELILVVHPQSRRCDDSVDM